MKSITSGSPLRCWGESAVKLKLAGQHFTWNFLLADVSTAILGIDFLRAHNLSVDPANCRLVQTGGRVFPTSAVTSGPTASVITGAPPPTSRPASAAAGVKLPSGLPAAALSVGREASSFSTPGPVVYQQAGSSTVAIYSTRSCCGSAGGHFFSGCGRRPAERRFRGQTYFHWQTSPVFPAPSPAFRGCGEPFKGPATDISRSRAPFGDQGAAHRLSFPPAGH
jgi:hypothetical protein